MTHKEISKKKALFPDGSFFRLMQNGFNVKHNGQTVSFYYKKDKSNGKAVLNDRVINFLDGHEFETCALLVNYQPEPEKVVPPIKEVQAVSGTQQCINHIERKIATIVKDKTRNNNQLITILKQLQNELKQYL